MVLACYTVHAETSSPLASGETYVSKALRQGATELLLLPEADRLEIYVVLDHERSREAWERLTRRLGPLQRICEQQACVERFFLRTAGLLNENLPGDPNAQQEIEEYVSVAAQQQSLGPVLARMFRDALEATEQVRQHTPVASGATTPAEAIAEIAAKILDHTSSALILGENEHTLPIAEALAHSGFKRFFFSHPEPTVTYEIANRWMLDGASSTAIGVPVDWEQREDLLAEVDLLVLTCDHISPCLSFNSVQPHLRRRRNRALIFIDAIRPEDECCSIDAAFSHVENLFVYTLQDLEGIVRQNLERRRRALPQARHLIAQRARRCFQKLYGADRYLFDGMIARSRTMHSVLELARRAAASDANILIQGETGTGKELLARAIHAQSARADRPFVVVNCGAIPEELLESELFGHVRGAFTGAVADKRGLVEEAHRGTLLLDEIGDMSLPLQVKLLRVIQEGEFRPVGSPEARKVDVRILASTHRDLPQLIREGKFREDLYYRLNVISITLPPLRERREDILPLAEAFLRRFNPTRRWFGRTPRRLRFAPQVCQRLLQYDWPGNVRELENVIERAVALALGEVVTLSALPENLSPQETAPQLLKMAVQDHWTLQELEKRYLEQILEETGWDYARTCQILGISRTTLWRRMNEYGLRNGGEV